MFKIFQCIQISKANAHFAAIDLFILKKKIGLKKVLRCLSSLRTWMLTLSFNILTCVYL